MRVITVEQIKTYLGITDATYDAELTAILPALDAKVKQITRNRWAYQFKLVLDETVNARVTSILGDPFFDLDTDEYRPVHSWGIGKRWKPEDVHEYLSAGTEIEGDGVPADTYITEVYSVRRTVGGRTYYAPSVELSNAATQTGTVEVEAGFNRAYHPVVAKLAFWMIDSQNTDSPSGSVASKSLGDISISYAATGADLDGRFGVPSWAIKGLPRYARGF